MKTHIICALLLICSSGLYSQEYKLPAGLTYEKPGNSADVTKTYKRKTSDLKSLIDESNDGILYQIEDITFGLYAIEENLDKNLLETFRKSDIDVGNQLGIKDSFVTEVKKNAEFSYYTKDRPLAVASKRQMTSYILDRNHSILVTCVIVYPTTEKNKADMIFNKFLSRLHYKKRN